MPSLAHSLSLSLSFLYLSCLSPLFPPLLFTSLFPLSPCLSLYLLYLMYLFLLFPFLYLLYLSHVSISALPLSSPPIFSCLYLSSSPLYLSLLSIHLTSLSPLPLSSFISPFVFPPFATHLLTLSLPSLLHLPLSTDFKVLIARSLALFPASPQAHDRQNQPPRPVPHPRRVLSILNDRPERKLTKAKRGKHAAEAISRAESHVV